MNITKKILCIIFLILTICLLPIFSATKLNFDIFIADEAFLLSAETKAHINSFLYDLQQKTGTDFAIVTLPTLDNIPIEQISLKIARTYGLGNDNNGLLMVVAPYEKQMRIETGYNLEGILPDSKLGRIRDEDILPYFKENQFEKGILRGSYIIATTIAQAYGKELTANIQNIPKQNNENEKFLTDLLFLLFVLFMLRKGFLIIPFGFSLKSSGGFGGFGGSGGFGGGGTSGRW